MSARGVGEERDSSDAFGCRQSDEEGNGRGERTARARRIERGFGLPISDLARPWAIEGPRSRTWSQRRARGERRTAHRGLNIVVLEARQVTPNYLKMPAARLISFCPPSTFPRATVRRTRVRKQASHDVRAENGSRQTRDRGE